MHLKSLNLKFSQLLFCCPWICLGRINRSFSSSSSAKLAFAHAINHKYLGNPLTKKMDGQITMVIGGILNN